MTFEWERICNDGGDSVHRAQVYGGWVVLTYVNEGDSPGSSSTVFVPDPGHKWNVEQ